jgi:hypothetical protein
MADSNITIPGFTRDMLADYEVHEAYCAELGIDPNGDDDTVFGTDYIYCSSHRRGHSTGWCTVRNVNKVPLNAPTAALAVEECRTLGYSLYEDDKR